MKIWRQQFNTAKIIMKKYTAIYDTETMKNVCYSTRAKDLEHAQKFFRNYISSPIKKIIQSSTWFSDPNGKDTVVYEA